MEDNVKVMTHVNCPSFLHHCHANAHKTSQTHTPEPQICIKVHRFLIVRVNFLIVQFLHLRIKNRPSKQLPIIKD